MERDGFSKKVVTLSLASHGAEASAHEFAAALVVSFDCVGGAGRPVHAGVAIEEASMARTFTVDNPSPKRPSGVDVPAAGFNARTACTRRTSFASLVIEPSALWL